VRRTVGLPSIVEAVLVTHLLDEAEIAKLRHILASTKRWSNDKRHAVRHRRESALVARKETRYLPTIATTPCDRVTSVQKPCPPHCRERNEFDAARYRNPR
jgi:hypothetical protein